MTERPGITKINKNDARVVAAAEAERRFFEYYGLDFNVHYVELKQPNMRVRVLDVGSGEPVLMVPGGTGDAFWFASLMAGLKGWRLLTVNRPGGGMSDGVDHRQIDIRHFAVTSLLAVMDTFDMKRVPVNGNSIGRIVVILAGSGSPARRVGWPRWPSRPLAWPSIGYEVPPFILIVLVRAALV